MLDICGILSHPSAGTTVLSASSAIPHDQYRHHGAKCKPCDSTLGEPLLWTAIQTPEVKNKTKLPQGHQAQAGASSTFAVEERLVVDQFAGFSGELSLGQGRRPAFGRGLPESAVAQDLLDDLGLPGVLDEVST